MPVKTAQRTANKLKPKFKSGFDSQGSYTGVNSSDIYEKPIQDADDL